MTYKRRNREFEQRLAHRRDELVLERLTDLLDACNTIMHTQELDGAAYSFAIDVALTAWRSTQWKMNEATHQMERAE